MILTFFRRLIHGHPSPLAEGLPCPKFSAVDTEGKSVSEQDLKGKRVVLWFYPVADTPG
ncbi:MAG: hypothetical protein COA70_09555 [Planctomycetota bacterium]|nr:MAG: hypothetical protein COA70_09555 [Planctomycetota bacterium]